MSNRGTLAQGEGKRVALWIRVSTEDQARGESPEHHEARARMYAEAKGWTVVTVYHLEGVSGKGVSWHPEAKRMTGDVESGAITGLIFSKLARLARSTKELLEFSEFFKEHNADLISLQESIDTSTPAGRLFYTVIAAMAQWEREEIADRVAASVPIRAKLGKKVGGAAPFGYAWKDGSLIPDEKEAPVRRLMYELFDETKRVKTVARRLNDRGYRTRRGGLFTAAAVYHLLFDPTAKGVFRMNYTTTRSGKKTLKPEHEWVYHSVPAIVSEELWHACTAHLDERREGMRPGRAAVHLFTGLTYCTCGKKMYVVSDSPKYVCQKCRTKIGTDDLEAVFVERLQGLVFSPESAAEQLVGMDTEIVKRTALLETLRQEQERLTSEADKLYRLYLDGNISGREFGERNQPLGVRREQLDREIPKLTGEIDFLTIRQLSSAEVLSEAQNLYSQWHDFPFGRKREIVESIVERVVVGPDEIEIQLNYLPPPPPPSSSSPDDSPPNPSSPEGAAKRGRSPPHFPTYIPVNFAGVRPDPGLPSQETVALPGHDQLAKDLVRSFFRDFLGLAAPEAAGRLRLEKASFVDTQSATDWPAGRRREMDLLARVPSRIEGERPVLVHVEIERRARAGMDLRMWLYYMQIRLRYGLLVVPILLNLKGGAPGVSRTTLAEGVHDPETARFRFRAFSVSGCLAQEYLRRPEPLAWALAALMRPGDWSRAEHRMACFRRIAAAKLPELQRFLLVNCVETYLQLSGQDAAEYARLAGRTENTEAIAMEMTWADRMRHEGRIEERAESIENLRGIVLHLLEQRFGPLPERVRRRVERFRTLRPLRRIAEHVLVASSLRDLGL